MFFDFLGNHQGYLADVSKGLSFANTIGLHFLNLSELGVTVGIVLASVSDRRRVIFSGWRIRFTEDIL